MEINLRDFRLRKLLTQAELADLAGVSRHNISRLESGQPARISTIKKLAAALDVAPEDLLIAPVERKAGLYE